MRPKPPGHWAVAPIPRLSGKRCSTKQAGLIRKLAKDNVLDVVDLVRRHGIETPEELSRDEASRLLDWCMEATRFAAEYPEEFDVSFTGRGRQTSSYRRYLNSIALQERQAAATPPPAAPDRETAWSAGVLWRAHAACLAKQGTAPDFTAEQLAAALATGPEVDKVDTPTRAGEGVVCED